MEGSYKFIFEDDQQDISCSGAVYNHIEFESESPAKP